MSKFIFGWTSAKADLVVPTFAKILYNLPDWRKSKKVIKFFHVINPSLLKHLRKQLCCKMYNLDFLLSREIVFLQSAVISVWLLSGFGMQCVCFFILYYVEMGTPAIIFLTLGVGASGFTVSGQFHHHLPSNSSLHLVMVKAGPTRSLPHINYIRDK